MTWTSALLVFAVIAAPAAQSSRDSASVEAVKRRLLGNWKLVKYQIFAENGQTRPGAYDAGRVMYGESGEMTAHLLRTSASKEPATTDATRAAAYQAYLGYFGPYTIDPDKHIVIHHVVGSSRPDWIGTEQVRHYGLSDDGNQLTLSLKSGERVTQTLTWERVR